MTSSVDGNEIERTNRLSNVIIGAAIEVHRELGPGLLESTYELCLCRELVLRGIAFERQVPLKVEYKGTTIDCAYRLDLVCGRCVIVEVKAVQRLEPIHEAQLLSYLRLSSIRLGLLINFNMPVLRLGIRRLVNG